MRVLLIMLLLAWAGPAAGQTARLQTGTIELLPGYELRALQGIDSAPGRILRADSSFVIHYDIGGMAGTRVGPLNEADYLWVIRHEVNGHRAYTGLSVHEGRRQIATTIHGDGSIVWRLPANFMADVRGEQDVAEFILITSTYQPDPSEASRRR